ncbi:MAG: PEP-CTERM sorting domain-containing protein, partial [Planctomycetota bacterium]
KFDLINGGTLEDVIDELNNGTLRVGIHIIGLPDGSSESAILVPEPATLFLLATGAAIALRKRKR